MPFPVVRLARAELRFAPRPWPFAQKLRAEIDAHFAELLRERPRAFNGRVLMLHQFAVEDGILRGAYFETDFASFIAWRDWDFPDPTVKNCFSLGALKAADGGFLLGVMGEHTLNAGKVYFPAGTPDPGDIVDGRVDLANSIRREVAEETGIGVDAYDAEDGWYCIPSGSRIAQIKVLHARESAAALRARALAHLASEDMPELRDIRIVRGPADLDPMMPPYVTAFLSHVWGGS